MLTPPYNDLYQEELGATYSYLKSKYQLQTIEGIGMQYSRLLPLKFSNHTLGTVSSIVCFNPRSLLSFYPKLMFCLRIFFFSQNSFRWCSFTAYIYEGIERGCALYCEGYVNPRGYEQKQFVRYGSGFVPIRYDVNPGYLAHG